MTSEIQLAGFGGQGILFAGKVLAYCGMMADREVSWLPSYGPEMRGGTCNCSVTLSDEPIGSPTVYTPDILIVMNEPSFLKFIDNVRPGGCAFVDSTLVDSKTDRTDIDVYEIPATSMAEENGLKGGANIIILGMLLKKTGIITLEEIEAAIRKIVPPAKAQLIENNMKAVSLGYDFS
ncbi:MAG: 2-oxoacid:acceptor oxidoreductase family protein [Oscillospiraceae bacterium]|nr:2-oxoacid:acceptor oxidoreductase family protein [Oscillospiraceae bacterium]MBQ8979755.1 2-oxoacid:acceptor oxidoreductase family protein [Oscillospiraceae bacterium]